MNPEQQSEYQQLNQEIVTCIRCRLSEVRIHAVPGEGQVPARILMVGEAPGKREDELGRPFVGRAGSVLQDLLSSINLSRDEVYITSIIKCRPPGNRDPKDDEIAACHPYLERQIALLRPSVIVPMGRFSAREISRAFGIRERKISDIHGRDFTAQASYGTIHILPVYHPAVVTHNPNLQSALHDDFSQLKKILDEIEKR
jgi:uracil-DNA glycosylase family 4